VAGMTLKESLYWDDFDKRIRETVFCLKNNVPVPVRRVAVFITEKCNFRCSYCNHKASPLQMDRRVFDNIVTQYGQNAIIHITGGEPSTVPWLYPYIEKYGDRYRFHLNTNAYKMPPADKFKRIKISLDSFNSGYWDDLVGREGAFDKVVDNTKHCIRKSVVSITYTMTKANLHQIPAFLEFSKQQFKGLYALFFSVYKGNDPKFEFNNGDAEYFCKELKPLMEKTLDFESKILLQETIDEKRRIVGKIRFPENNIKDPCWLSLSERVFAPDGTPYGCSHLYRDGVKAISGQKHEKCGYGCNRKLVKFNQEIDHEFLHQTPQSPTQGQSPHPPP
jgi:MoaA/NifB/PqqE/SkfB family radical SAM enzyme